jgi:hypothetical protein
MKSARRLLCTLALLLVAAACQRRTPTSWLGSPEHVAPGVDLYRSADASLVADAGPIAVSLLRLDLAQVRMASVLSNDEVVDTEDVASIALRHQAIAAVNGGFFNRANGEPLGLLKVAGQLVSDSGAAKGAVIISPATTTPPAILFDQLAARVQLTFTGDDHQAWTVPVDGVDTTRERGRLMLYTPAYHADTDTAPTGTEWVLDGTPLHVVALRPGAGHSPIPPRGAVLSFGGTTLPPALASLSNDVVVTMTTTWRSTWGVPAADLDAAETIVGGAGLLRRGGTVLRDWKSEALATESFTEARHPRTMIGLDRQKAVWLAAVDGRLPDYSIGMTFADLQRLADRLDLSDALNLDGGGSTTMVVRGQIVNRPSDPTGPRPVGDALIVTARGRVE